MRLIVVRHYKTRSNAKGCIIGWGDSPPSDDWEKDLIQVDRDLKRQGIDFDAIYSSNLTRARQTADYYARRAGITSVHHSEQLNEVNYGSLYQKSKHWVSTNIPAYKTDPDYVFPEGESFCQMRTRCIEFVTELEHRHSAHTLLLVVHAGVIRGLICQFLGLDYASNLKRKISHRYIGDFQIEQGHCTHYQELGKPSGFITQGVISPPTDGDSAHTQGEPPLPPGDAWAYCPE